MFVAFGPIIFLLGINPKEIIHQEEGTIRIYKDIYRRVIYDGEKLKTPSPANTGGWSHKGRRIHPM